MITPRADRIHETAARLAAELALRPESVATMTDLAGGDDVRLLGGIAAVSLRHRTALPVLRRLAGAGIDLGVVPLDPAALQATALPRAIPKLRSDPPEDLAALAAVIAEHQNRLRRILDAIGEKFPFQYLVGYGLGIDLVSRDTDRESSDIDLFSPSRDAVERLGEWLVAELGFVARPVVERRSGRSDLPGRKLWVDEAGHHLGVDLYGPGRPSGGHSWLPPYRDPGLVTRARPVAPPGPAVLVASPEDALAMLAEKTLRKGEFTHRRIRDAVAILRSADVVDGERLAEIASAQHVAAPLVWLLEQSVASGAAVDNLLDHLAPPRWERRMIAEMAEAPLRRATRVRAIHRRIWVARYVRDSPRHGSALVEVLRGRFRKPQGPRSR